MAISNQVATNFLQFQLEPENNQRLASLCGELGRHIKIIQDYFNIKIQQRGHHFILSGADHAIAAGERVLRGLYRKTDKNRLLDPEEVHMSMQEYQIPVSTSVVLSTKKAGKITAKNEHQANYLMQMQRYDVNFGIGPAGTGKTFLAVLCAVQALAQEQVKRIVLVRPAVEAGESLGYLPGDFAQKVEPYLRPLYDALHDLMGNEWVQKYVERGQIEVAPLAYMRGRTLNDAFIILDEAQNTTKAQMKMFLTRLGFGSTAVITGDLTQIDLPGNMPSGLTHALTVLQDEADIGITYFTAKDAVRHRLVQKIINAYDRYDKQINNK